jgi:DNA polymerase III epsilon subunit-like protein
MKYIILDTETTGLNGKIIELAFMVIEPRNSFSTYQMYHTYCYPGDDTPIEYEAMATHHIVPEMIEDEPAIENTMEFKLLNELNTPENIMVIHNAEFDLAMLEKAGFKSKMQLIDTLIVSRHLFPASAMHKMQYFRYSLGLHYLEKAFCESHGIPDIKAHRADGDVVVLQLLFERLREGKTDKELIQLTNKIPLVYRMPFGKHRNMLVQDLVKNDKKYVRWMLDKLPDLSKDLRYTLNYYLNGEVISLF